MRYAKNLFSRHYLGIFFAVVVGSISIAPQILLINAIGNEYKGIHLSYPDDNTYYMARMRDILDGYGFVSSPFIYEYKDQRPLVYPVGEYFYALPSILFGIPLVSVLVFNKFLFPFVLFLLAYALVYLLTAKPNNLPGKINALAGALLVTLGYNFIDYKNTWLVLTGHSGAVSLLWTRPVNPVTGAIFLFLFLSLVWLCLSSHRLRFLIYSGLTFSLMVGYFFTWSLSLSIVATLAVIFLLSRRYSALKSLGYIALLGFLFSLPYWYNILRFLESPDREIVSARNGMIFTDEPIYNKILIITSLLFFSALLIEYRKKGEEERGMPLSWFFSSSILLGSLFALNQQVITGRSIWPYHFVQYTIPLSFVVLTVTLFNFLRPRLPKLHNIIAAFVILLMLSYGIASMLGYKRGAAEMVSNQRYGEVLSWLQKNAEKDCVVLVREGLEERLTRLIPSFTRCNVYTTQWILFGVVSDESRIRHNILTTLRVNGLRPSNAEAYLKKNSFFLRDYLFRDWLDYTRADIKEEDEKRIKEISEDYTNFVKEDFVSSLKKYKIDYIASDGAVDSHTLKSLPGLVPLSEFNGTYIYKI